MSKNFAETLRQALNSRKALENDSQAEKANDIAAHGDAHPDTTAEVEVKEVEAAEAETAPVADPTSTGADTPAVIEAKEAPDTSAEGSNGSVEAAVESGEEAAVVADPEAVADPVEAPVEAPVETQAEAEGATADVPAEVPAGDVTEETPIADEVPAIPEDCDTAGDDSELGSTDAQSDVDAVQRETSELAEATAGLESIMSAIESYPDGMDSRAAQLASIATESYVGKWNLGSSLVPSMESFSGTQARKHANSVAVENLSETLKQAYEYVKQLLAKAIAAIKEFLAKVFDRAEWLIKRAGALKTSAASLKGTPKESQVDIGSLAGRFSIGGKVPGNLRDVFTKADTLFGIAEETDKVVEQMEQDAITLFQKIGTSQVGEDGNQANTFEQLLASLSFEVKVPAHFKPTGAGQWATEVFPGEVYYAAAKSSTIASINGLNFSRHRNDTAPSTTTIHTSSPADIAQVADDAMKFAHRAQIARNSLKLSSDGSIKAMIAALGSGQAMSDTVATAAGRIVQVKAKEIQAARYSCAQMFADAISASIAVVKAAEVSAKQYQTPGSGFRVPGADTLAKGFAGANKPAPGPAAA